MSIYVGAGRINYPAMRGPCPYGYHVPSSNECKALGTILTTRFGMASNWTTPKTYLKMPAGGYRAYSNGGVTSQGTIGRYFCCTPYDSLAYIIYFSSGYFYCGTSTNQRGIGMLIRPFKDEQVKPTSSRTTLYDGSSVASGAGIFRDSASGLISISDDGTNWITIADKNLGATTVYNDGDTLSEANCGKYFQFGNNYPFPRTGSVTTSSTQINASAYGPGNWYYSSTYITTSAYPYDRSSSKNDNLRGGVVGAVKADVKDICVGAGVMDYPASQGPCPDGFHIPTFNTDFDKVKAAGITLGARTSSGGVAFSQYLKMPRAGYISGSSGSKSGSGSQGWYAVTAQTGGWYLSTSVCAFSSHKAIDGINVRPFKNEPVKPDSTWTTLYAGTGNAGIFWSKGLGLISISSNGNTWYTIADKNLGAKKVWNDGDTLSEDNCGFYYQPGNNYGFPYSGPATTSTTQVDVSNYGPTYPYYSSTFIKANRRGTSKIYVPGQTDSMFYSLRGLYHKEGFSTKTRTGTKGNVKRVYVGTTPARPTYNPGIYWNKAKGLISISSDGKNWYTIADKNMGAKVVYNDGDTLSQDNCGYYYQWGNNYGFAYSGSITTSSTKVNTTSYGPTNPYYGSTFITASASPYDWSNSTNDNLWGNTTNTLEARQGPCPTGFYVPKSSERQNIKDIGVTLGAWTSSGGTAFIKLLKIPKSGRRTQSGSTEKQGSTGYVRCCNKGTSVQTYAYSWSFSNTTIIANESYRAHGNALRPFKNEPVVPDNSRYVLYQPS